MPDTPTLDSLRESVNGGRPFGSEQWVAQAVRHLGLEFTLRGPGRPRKKKAAGRQNGGNVE